MRPEFPLAAAGLHTDDPTAPISQASRAQSSDLPANPHTVPQLQKPQPHSTNLYHKKRFHNLFAHSFLPFPSRNNKELRIFAEGKNRCSVKLEFFIARRIASSAGRDGHNVMVRIATATVATGVAVMIVALAVITGFRREITSKIIGFDAQIQLTNLDSNSSLERTPITASPTLEQRIAEIDGVTSISKFAVKGGIIRTDEAIQGVMLKGVDQNYDSTFFKQNLIAGSLPRTDGRQLHKDLLISESLASRMAPWAISSTVKLSDPLPSPGTREFPQIMHTRTASAASHGAEARRSSGHWRLRRFANGIGYIVLRS